MSLQLYTLIFFFDTKEIGSFPYASLKIKCRYSPKR